MKKFIALVALLIAFSVGAAHNAQAHSTWKHFGADKAYPTREAAISDAPRVLRQMHYPEPVIALFIEAMKKPGKEAHVTNGDVLDFMRSGSKALWRSVLVAFDKPPIKDAMEYSAPSEEWSVEWNGTTYTAGLPYVCRNLYGRHHASVPVKVIRKTETVIQAPPAVRCPMIRVFVHPGDTALQHIQLTPDGRVAANAQCPFLYRGPGDKQWFEMMTHCPYGPCDFSKTINASGLVGGPSGGLNLTNRPGEYDFQVSWEWVRNHEAIYAFCLMMGGTSDSCAKDIRSADFTDGIAIVGYGDNGEVPAGWKGHERIWCRPETVQGHCEFCPN